MTTIPTISQLQQSIYADLKANMDVTTIGKVALMAIALMQAAKIKLIYLAIGNLQKNIFVDTAESESIGGTLERFGRVKLNRNPYPSVQGQYVVSVTGTAGATIAANTQFISSQTSTSPGYIYVLDQAYVCTGSADQITLRALIGGTVAKLLVGDTLTSASPIAGVQAIVTVTSVPVLALDAETLDAYRAAAIFSYRAEPQGGAAVDYRLWALDAQGVANSYPYAASGEVYTVNSYVEAIPADSTDGKGTPSGYNVADPTTPLPNTILAAVKTVVDFNPDTTLPLNQRGRKPIGVVVNYLPVSIITIAINITGGSWTTAQQTAISNAIIAAVGIMRPFVAAADIIQNKNDYMDSNVLVSFILAAAPGSVFGAVTIRANGTPVSSYTFINGNIPSVSPVTFV